MWGVICKFLVEMLAKEKEEKIHEMVNSFTLCEDEFFSSNKIIDFAILI